MTNTALYTSILTDVYNITQRPDLVNETAIAIRKATMKAHTADLWKNDLTIVYPVTPIEVADTSYTYRYYLDLTNTAVFPQYRKVSDIKEYNNPLTGYELQFDEKDVDRILDQYLLEDVNYWYQAGRQVQIRSTKALVGIQVAYWQYPIVDPTLYNSWIANDFPDIIEEEACAQLYRVIGKLEEAARLAMNFMDNFHILQATQI